MKAFLKRIFWVLFDLFFVGFDLFHLSGATTQNDRLFWSIVTAVMVLFLACNVHSRLSSKESS